MSNRQRLLLLDDDPDMLEIYREILQRLPTQPEVQTASAASRALSLIETERFDLLITDLSMPKMDGLQVLAVVRRRWPNLRTVVMTSVQDEQLRRRAYGMGVELVCDKPSTSKEIETFLGSIHSLLTGVKKTQEESNQDRSLASVIHLECLARNTSVIRCSSPKGEGRVWIQGGELIDAASGSMVGDEALQRMLAMADARCEVLPGEPGRPRRIFTAPADSRIGAIATAPDAKADMHAATAGARPAPVGRLAAEAAGSLDRSQSRLAELSRVDGVEMLVEVGQGGSKRQAATWGVEHPEELVRWTSAVLETFGKLGATLGAGEVVQVDALGTHDRLSLIPKGDKGLCVGLRRSLAPEQAREVLRLVLSRWAS